jgi:hypothetical protein
MAGLKMRVVGSPIYNDIFTALGANPTQMSWADAQPALTTGAVDGQENPLTIYSVLKMHELGQNHITLWRYVADPLIFAVNQEVWDSFSAEDQGHVREAAEEAGAYGIEVARAGLTAGDESLIEEIEGNGVTITRLSRRGAAGLRRGDPRRLRGLARADRRRVRRSGRRVDRRTVGGMPTSGGNDFPRAPSKVLVGRGEDHPPRIFGVPRPGAGAGRGGAGGAGHGADLPDLDGQCAGALPDQRTPSPSPRSGRSFSWSS